jgi:HAD superfamily hydrolase (TIGR01549 family)
VLRAVLFDFAGTLFMPRSAREMVAAAADGPLSETDVDALARVYERAGMPGGPYPEAVPAALAEAYAARDRGPDEHERAFAGLLQGAGEPEPGFAARVYRQIRAAEGWVPYPDAEPTVSALIADGLRVGIVSNVGFDLRPILRAHGFGALAEHCVLSFEVGATKPDPAIFAAALAVLGTDATDTLMVGDHEEADGGAAALGMPTLILPMTPPGTIHGLKAVLVASRP